jgi:hypothetical protein
VDTWNLNRRSFLKENHLVNSLITVICDKKASLMSYFQKLLWSNQDSIITFTKQSDMASFHFLSMKNRKNIHNSVVRQFHRYAFNCRFIPKLPNPALCEQRFDGLDAAFSSRFNPQIEIKTQFTWRAFDLNAFFSFAEKFYAGDYPSRSNNDRKKINSLLIYLQPDIKILL